MKRTTKEIFRLMAIMVGGFCAFTAISFLAYALLPPSIAQIFVIPFFLLWILVVVAPLGIGPIGKRLNEAAKADAEEERKALEPKYPWK